MTLSTHINIWIIINITACVVTNCSKFIKSMFRFTVHVHTYTDFMNYFTYKINTIRDQTVTMQLPAAVSHPIVLYWSPEEQFHSLSTIGEEELYKLVKSNQIKSNQIKSNHFYCHITTAQVPWWVKFLWACSRQCRKTTDNLPMDRQCKKNNRQFTYGQTVQKSNSNLHMDSTYLQTVQKTMCKIHIHILSTHSVL